MMCTNIALRLLFHNFNSILCKSSYQIKTHVYMHLFLSMQFYFNLLPRQDMLQICIKSLFCWLIYFVPKNCFALSILVSFLHSLFDASCCVHLFGDDHERGVRFRSGTFQPSSIFSIHLKIIFCRRP